MEELLAITILVVFASFVGTISGFGLATIMVPVMLLFFGFAETLLLVGTLHFFNDVWKLVLFREGVRWKLILLFGIPSVVFTYFGARLAFLGTEDILRRLLGVFLLVYTGFLFVHRQFKITTHPAATASGGALGGFVVGLFGVGGEVRSAFLAAFNLPKSVYLATIGAIALATDAVRVTTYFFEGASIDRLLVIGLLIFIPATFYGAKVAQLVVGRIPQKQFRLVIATFLLIAGIKFILFP